MLRSKIWYQPGLESKFYLINFLGEGTYAVTSEIVRLLRFILEVAPQEEFKNAMLHKLKKFLTSPVDQWQIEESDILLGLFNGGTFTTLTTGS